MGAIFDFFQLNPAKVRECFGYEHQSGYLVSTQIPALIVLRNVLKESPLAVRQDVRRAVRQVQAVLHIALEVAGTPGKEPKVDRKSLLALQVQAFVMAGGGFIGNSAATKPGSFYIDDRSAGNRPYSDEAVYRFIEEKFVPAVKAMNLDPENLPSLPKFHNCGIF